jgi:SRSO17 transposase
MDETADEKSSAGAVGAARQYSGTVGGIALCQVAVTLTYATSRGHALIAGPCTCPKPAPPMRSTAVDAHLKFPRPAH